jgi:hypothetical protein
MCQSSLTIDGADAFNRSNLFKVILLHHLRNGKKIKTTSDEVEDLELGAT